MPHGANDRSRQFEGLCRLFFHESLTAVDIVVMFRWCMLQHPGLKIL